MLYALNIENQKISATKFAIGHCPLCEEKLVPKCGEIKIWHWAHQSVDNCDLWHEHETPWHLKYKQLVPKEFCEVTIVQNGKKHIADIKGLNGVIELQHSPISPEEIREREEFYGESMVWIFDGTELNARFEYTNLPHFYYYKDEKAVYDKGTQKEITVLDYYKFHWKHCKKTICSTQRKVFLDLGQRMFQIKKLHDNGNGWGYVHLNAEKKFNKLFGMDEMLNNKFQIDIRQDVELQEMFGVKLKAQAEVSINV